MSAPTIRSYESHRSRAGDVVTQVIGEDVQGMLGSNCSAGSTIHAGRHQRWWVPVFQDVHNLTKTCPQDEILLLWATHVNAVSDDAVAWATSDPDSHRTPREQHQARLAHQHAFEQLVWERCRPSVLEDVPHQIPCTRVERVLPARCVCIAIPGVPANTTRVGRSGRPLVSARTIRGSTRSPRGSQIRMRLASLFGAWADWFCTAWIRISETECFI